MYVTVQTSSTEEIVPQRQTDENSLGEPIGSSGPGYGRMVQARGDGTLHMERTACPHDKGGQRSTPAIERHSTRVSVL